MKQLACVLLAAAIPSVAGAAEPAYHDPGLGTVVQLLHSDPKGE
jgi:hypothetical protein